MLAEICTVVLSFANLINGHGLLLVPPGRSTLWRDNTVVENNPGITIERNYQDNELFCGGFQYQQNLGGKCGVCGDPYDAKVRENEAGGKYAKGIIARQYGIGDQITATVDITAHHKGYFEFRLCPWNNPYKPVKKECLDNCLLVVASGKQAGQTRWFLPESIGSGIRYDINLQLPENVECSQCVLQWRYHTGNSWGCDADTKKCCVGCGPQEEFYACSDIAIGDEVASPVPTISSSTMPTSQPTVSTTNSTASTSTTTTKKETTKTTTEWGEGGCDSTNIGDVKGNGCYAYYICDYTGPVEFSCPPGTVYDNSPGHPVCNHPYNVDEPCGVNECKRFKTPI